MVMNEKYFPKRARFVISNRLVDLAMDVSEKFDGANAIFPSSEKYLSDREELQVLGKSSFVSLKKQLNIAYQLFPNIPSGVMGEVFDLTSSIDSKYNNWFKSGRKVLKRELLKQEAKKSKDNDKNENTDEEPKLEKDDSLSEKILVNYLSKIGGQIMNRKEREEVFKAINDVANRVNDVSQKLDEVMQKLNANANEKISVNSGGIDGLADMVSAHDGAIEDLAIIVAELEVK